MSRPARDEEPEPAACPHCTGTGERHPGHACDVCHGSGLARETDDGRCSPDDFEEADHE